MQPNIRGFLKSREKYLFLVTRCTTRGPRQCGRLYIVGYLVKQDYEVRPGGFYAVLGDIKLYSFDDAYPLSQTPNFRHCRRVLTERLTAHVLDHYVGARDTFRKCLKAIRKLNKRLHEGKAGRPVRTCR
jgi:hypothetical protein